MFAIIETGGKQYKVSKGDIFEIELVDAAESISFDRVLLVGGDENTIVGTPYVSGAKVQAKVLGTGKDPKVTTFKYKNKTNYHRKIGHRQPFTRIEIEEVIHGA